ncbi:unnamed protein product [Colias eurytheme]|nr:unnamed protein product [Colias eurytheme]
MVERSALCYQTRSAFQKLAIPRHHSAGFKGSFRYSATKCWNNLPPPPRICLGIVQKNRLGKTCKLPEKKDILKPSVPRGSYDENVTTFDGVEFSATSWKDDKQDGKETLCKYGSTTSQNKRGRPSLNKTKQKRPKLDAQTLPPDDVRFDGVGHEKSYGSKRNSAMWNWKKVFNRLGTEEQCIQFSVERNLIPAEKQCSYHRRPMTLSSESTQSDGTHTQRIESQWRGLKKAFRQEHNKGDFTDWLIEYSYRRKIRINHRDPFEELLNAVEYVYRIN